MKSVAQLKDELVLFRYYSFIYTMFQMYIEYESIKHRDDSFLSDLSRNPPLWSEFGFEKFAKEDFLHFFCVFLC